ncbi:MAG TPA: fatty acyl-AMP ligase [Acidimicrobiales bacterium]|nr:fatty acyl-AMP ligase [Acidimicrobiales bacterium]
MNAIPGLSSTLVGSLEQAAERGHDVTFLVTDEPERVPWSQMYDDARRFASAMQARGVGPGERVALLGSTSRELVTAIEATWLAGAAVIVLPLPTRLGSEEEFRAQTHARISLGDVTLTVSDPDFLAAGIVEADEPAVVSFGQLVSDAAGDAGKRYERPPDDPEATAVLQFTSGSTDDPKGVVIPVRCVLDNLGGMADRVPISEDDDAVVSWLPLYHDMGLVANTAYAMAHGAHFVVAPPARFITSPAKWMQWMAEYKGTWTLAPNFALSMASRLLATADPLDLSSVRCLGSGSEPVAPDVMHRFTDAARPHGLDPGVMYAAYGMAEATVCISVAPMGTGFTVDVVDGVALEQDLRAEPVAPDHPRARALARCGPPIRGMEMRICDPDSGAAQQPGMLGEIEIRGPSVVPGYFERPDATARAFRDGGWLRTGDLGYLAQGDVVICGRLKDLIIVGGRNLFPEDLERAAQGVDGVRTGNVIAFGVDGGRRGDDVVIVAEVKTEDTAAVRDGIAKAVTDAVGVRPEDIVLLRPGTLPKTSSGKLRRSICRSRYRTAELDPL